VMGCMFATLGPLISLLALLPPLLMDLRLLLCLLLGFKNLGCLTFDETRADSAQDQLEVLRAHWSAEEWAELIGGAMSQIFATAEVDDSTTNPLRLNSQGRMRWLCDRTMQLNGKVDTMDRALNGKVDTMERELTELKKTMNTKLDAVTELLKQMEAK
jgi:hypothetical protein